MKKILFCTVLSLLFTISFYSQKAPRYYEVNNAEAEEKAGYKNKLPLKYFNLDGSQLSKKEFKKIVKKRRLLQIPGDSLHHRKLVKRENHGMIKDYPKFIKLIETELDTKIDPEKPIVVIYYPGPNACNSSGSATKKTRNKWFSEMEAGIIGKTNEILYLYKTTKGMKGRYDLDKYKKDPQGIMEQLFFPYNYPCSSFVVIGKTGKYITFYGEFGKPLVWKFIDYVRKKY